MTTEDQQYQVDLTITSKEGNTLRAIGNLQPKEPSNMVDYNFSGKFSAAPTGPFTNANKKLVWPSGNGSQGVTADFDTGGSVFSLVDDSRLGGRCQRMKYPKGKYGMQNQSYQVSIKAPRTVCNVEFDWLFESGFSFMTPNANKNCGGKIGPCINWGPIGGSNDVRGTRCMWWWNGHGSNYPNPKFSPSCQDQATGNQYVQPVWYSESIATEKVYHFKIEMKGGNNGYAKYYKDSVMVAQVASRYLKYKDDDDVYYDFAFFSGGASNDYCPEHDSYARVGNIKIYSGTAVAPPGPDPTPEPEPEPIPPSGAISPFSIAIGETKVFQAKFIDDGQYPPKEIPAGGPVQWSMDPNVVTWGPGMDPNWQGIQVTGKTAASAASVQAKDPVSGISTEVMKVDITTTPRADQIRTGTVTVEKLPATQVAAASEFSDEPPQ